MKNSFTKISLFILTGLIIFGCNTTKRVPDGKKLLTKNDIYVDEKKNNLEDVYNQLYQKQNSSILGYHLRLNLYNLAKPKSDSLFKAKMIKHPKRYYWKAKWLSKKQVKRLGESFLYSGFDNFLRKTGEAPVILDTASTKKSLRRLKSYYFNKGYFDVTTGYTIDSIGPKKIKLKYNIANGTPYVLDTLSSSISSHPLDSIYQLKKPNSLIKSGQQFNKAKFDEEKARITEDFRNNGAYRFQQNYVNYNLDTIGKTHKVNIQLLIENESIRTEDSLISAPFELYKISKVNIFTDHNPSEPNAKITDSITYKDFTLYGVNKIKYRPKAITDGVFVTKGNYYADYKNALTSKYLSNLKVFNYPLIQYVEDKNQPNGLIANIYLPPRKKYTFGSSTDFLHSNIQDFGISGNVLLAIRNVFNGAETFDVGFRGNIGSSKDLANPNNNFFNISEIGVDANLNFPRLFLPFKTDKIIPKTMIPFTKLSVGYSKQTNIGLDKQNFTCSLTYNWTPKKGRNFKFELFNIQFVKNLNPGNYYNIYKSSYNTINNIAQGYPVNPTYFDTNGNLIIEDGVNGFITDVANQTTPVSLTDAKSILSIVERKTRLTENNLIFASSLSYTKTSQKDLFDNDFYAIKTKFESAGNVLSAFARAAKQLKNQNGANTIFDVEFSQYVKGEFEYIKHWDLRRKKVLAARAFFGMAIPYGNSTSVPFSRSYFAGGSNDIRAWQSYSLGPGSSGSFLDFNDANMKLTLSTELRFNIFQKLNGALFADGGNIWNVLDNVTTENAVFSGIKSLENMALGTGFGFRYDFSFFILRLDMGFKTYNPAIIDNEKWFREMRFDKSVLNIGINYPF
ncbi:BamA/TamA family outer membrane protein [Flavobacterium sp. XGLA_31]|uniref:translocation and assembly module lipoprotein TamL n=1 Tax=Flavobacterium sp. XGLA_31 TaxID=3447666 RepID=UPI003F389271